LSGVGIISTGNLPDFFRLRTLRGEKRVSPGVWVGISVRSPPFDLFDILGTYHETSPDPLVLGPEPELADDIRRKRERPESRNFLWTDLVRGVIRVNSEPGLPDLHEPDGFRLVDQKVKGEIIVCIVKRTITHPFGKTFRFRDRCDRFFTADHSIFPAFR